MSVEFNAKAALGPIRGKTVSMVEAASEFLAVHAQERAPIGKGTGKGRGISPRTFGVKLRPLKEFRKTDLKGKQRQVELLGYKPSELGGVITSKDLSRFRLTGGPDKGQTPDIIEPGKRGILKGAKIYSPGRLRRGIHATAVKSSGSVISGRVVSDAPYSIYVEKGFHHKGGTVVEGRHFMQKALEEDTREGFIRGDFFPR